MWFLYYLRAQAAGSRDDCVKVFYLEPEQDTVPGRRCICVYKVGVIFFVPGMELENQAIVAEYALVHVAMGVFRERLRSEQLLVPATARPYVAHRN
jgi:hypothetical protein